MPLLLLAVMGPSLFLTMGWSHARFQEVEKREREFIALDNASIALGRSARDCFRQVDRGNELGRNLEKAHHVAHTCARTTGLPSCVAADSALEAQIAANQLVQWRRAQATWSRGRASAQQAALALGQEAVVERLPVVPLRPKRCPVCGLSMEWTVVAPPSERVRVGKFGNAVVAGGQPWDYSVRERENGQ